MKLEVIATNLSDALLAQNNGADRIELVTGILEGGLTPSPGLIRQVVNAVEIPVHVMVRPHSQSFVYDEHDVTTMLDDISFIRESGAAGIVLGTLTDDAKVDTKTLEVLLQAAGSMNVTYHRAFDEIADQHEALQVLSAYPQINRILTSAGPRSALQSVEEMKALVHASAHTQITILAGAGLTVPGLAAFVEHTGVKEVHFGSALRKDGQYLRPIEPEKVQAAAKIIASFER